MHTPTKDLSWDFRPFYETRSEKKNRQTTTDNANRGQSSNRKAWLLNGCYFPGEFCVKKF